MEQAEQAFSGYAAAYDSHFTDSLIGKMQRARVWKFMMHLDAEKFPEVLEIGCGTGEDARWLAQQGFSVTATDASPGMVEVAKRKLNQIAGIRAVEVCNAKEVVKKFNGQKFDLIFSDFGAVNCLSPGEFRVLAEELQQLLQPGGRIVLVVMSPRCLWERFYFGRKKDPEKAGRRRHPGGAATTINGVEFRTWYYAAADIARLFEKQFYCGKRRPVGLFIPPSYLENYFSTRRGRLRTLGFLERVFSASFFSDYADHFYIELKQRSA